MKTEAYEDLPVRDFWNHIIAILLRSVVNRLRMACLEISQEFSLRAERKAQSEVIY